MANYGQMSMNNIGMNMNTIGMTVNNAATNNPANGVQVNGLNNMAIPTRVNVINNSLAVGNVATIRNVNGNYGMVNIANQNMANIQLRNGINATAVGANRIVGTTGITYANANPVLQQRVATASQIPAANIQTSNIYNQYQYNANIINVAKKNVGNLSPVNNAASLGNVGQRLVQTYPTSNLQNVQFQKPVQVNTITPQNIQLLNQNTIIAKPATTLNQPQVAQPKNVVNPPVQQTTPTTATGVLNDPNNVKPINETLTTNVSTPSSLAKQITTNKNIENLNQTPIQNIKNESITTPVVSTNQTITTLTPNSEGTNETTKINSTVNTKENSLKIEKNELNSTVKPTISTPISETEEAKKTQLTTTTTQAPAQAQSTGVVSTSNTTYPVANGSQNKTGNVTATTTSNTGVSYNQGKY